MRAQARAPRRRSSSPPARPRLSPAPQPPTPRPPPCPPRRRRLSTASSACRLAAPVRAAAGQAEGFHPWRRWRAAGRCAGPALCRRTAASAARKRATARTQRGARAHEAALSACKQADATRTTGTASDRPRARPRPISARPICRLPDLVLCGRHEGPGAARRHRRDDARRGNIVGRDHGRRAVQRAGARLFAERGAPSAAGRSHSAARREASAGPRGAAGGRVW
jgi:hypothetical protein